MDDALHTCCFIGHREIEETEELKAQLLVIIEELIKDEQVDIFLFGSKSRFNDLCHEITTKVLEKYPKIKRIYVRAEYPNISERYRAYLLKDYEDTYYPKKLLGSGRAAYVERNYEMINSSRFCIIYYDEAYAPIKGKSGTRLALDYAKKKKKEIIELP